MNIAVFIIAAVVGFAVQIAINKITKNQLIKFIPMGVIMIGMIICLIIYMGVFGANTESAIAENRAFAMFLSIPFSGALAGCLPGLLLSNQYVDKT